MASKSGVLTHLCETSNSSIDELDDDSINITSGSDSTSASKATVTSEALEGSNSSIAATTTSDSTSKKTQSSLLSVLQQAKSSDLCWKRVIRNNLPLKEKKRKVSATSSFNLKSVSPKDRCRQFSKECFTVSGGKLFCGCCREEVSLKLSSIKNHIGSNKHKMSKDKEAKKKVQDKILAQHLEVYESETSPRGETLPESHKLYRIDIVTAFLKSGIPLQKIDGLREVLEYGGYRLTDARGMRDLVQFVRSNEENKIKEELSEKFVSVIFDGTTRLGEAFAIVLRFVLEGKIVQRLVKLQILVKSMNADELACEVISV